MQPSSCQIPETDSTNEATQTRELKLKIIAPVSVTNTANIREPDGGLELNIGDKDLESAWFDGNQERSPNIDDEQ